MTDYSEIDLSRIKDRFKAFAEYECKDYAELYYKLSYDIANDDEVSNIASFAKSSQPVPNIFFGAVHYLLLKNKKNKLAQFYPTITKIQNKDRIPFDLFKEFCIQNEIKIKKIISERIVQTNVLNRCSYLYPVFSNIISKEGKPTTIIDIGTSAGLTLNFDKYEYWYNESKIFGESRVKNYSKIIDSEVPELKPISQKITKIGIDQNLINPKNEDEKLWLNSLIWADHIDRFTYMEEALKLKELDQINFIQGKSVLDFEIVINKIEKSETLIVFATHTLYQFSPEEKIEFYNMLDKIGKQRDFYYLSVESMKSFTEKYNTNNAVIELITYKNCNKKEELIGETNGHGNWITWK